MEDFNGLLRLIVVGLLLVIFSYAIVRGISFAYFRTKYEYMRRMLKELNEGEK